MRPQVFQNQVRKFKILETKDFILKPSVGLLVLLEKSKREIGAHKSRLRTQVLDGFNRGFPKCFFTEFEIYDIKRTRTCHTATSCVRDQHATTVRARHV